MGIEFLEKKIIFDKERLTVYDEFVLDFFKNVNIKYVIISGYVSLLFGRERVTEDIDVFIEKPGFDEFLSMWNSLLEEGYYCMNTDEPKAAYHDYLSNNTAIRFAKEGNIQPNVEMKFIKIDLDKYSMENRIEVILNGKSIFISPMESHVGYKLYLGADKDLEDARYIYKMFKDKIDIDEVLTIMRRLKVPMEKLKELE